MAAVGLGGCGGTRDAELSIIGPKAPLDAPLVASVAGLDASERVTATIRTRDARGIEWSHEVAARARRDGVARIDVRALIPELRPARADAGLFPPDVGFRFEIEVVLEDGRRLQAEAPREIAAAGTRIRPLVSPVAGQLTTPKQAKPVAVVWLGGSEGGLTGNLTAALLAARGYPVLQLAYFAHPGLPAELERIELEYFVRALRWMRSRHEAVVLLGRSRGAELALLLASRFPALVDGVAAYAPSSVVNASPADCSFPAWTLAGRPLPFAGCDAGGPAGNPRARIPVERIRAPVLLVAGVADAVWPAAAYASAVEKRARDVTSVVSYDAGHGVAAVFPLLPLPVGDHGGDPHADARTRTRAWAKLLALLEGVTETVGRGGE